MIITIDGPSGSGKSSISKAISRDLGYFYLDSGAIYRALGYYFYSKRIDPDDESLIISKLHDIEIEIKRIEDNYRYYLNGQDISEYIRTPELSHYASVISKYRAVRNIVRDYSHKVQKSYPDMVAEGRDAGTVLFPESPLKFFLTASTEERARRRQKDYFEQNINKSIDEIISEIAERDERDTRRELDPLRKAEDSAVIDTTDLSFDEVIKKITNIINDKIMNNGGSLSDMDNYENNDIIKDGNSNSNDKDNDLNKGGGITDKHDMAPEGKDQEDKSFAEILEDYDTNMANVKAKQIVQGKIVRITDSDVFIDIGFKSEGILPINEFSKEIEFKDENFKEGGTVSVFVESTEDDEGNLKLSKVKADKILLWDRLKELDDNNGIVKGKVVQLANNGGLVVDLGVLSGFIPAGHISMGPDEEVPLGTIVETKILSLERDKKKIILSRRLYFEEQRKKIQRETLEKLHKGQIIKAVIKKIEPDHLIAEVDGITAFMHKKEMSWGRIEKPEDLFEKDQEIEAVIKSINKKKYSIRISYKDKTANPWTLVNTKYSVGQKLEGKVMSIKPYGLFVQLEPGVEGLIHVSEMSWDKVPKNPEQHSKVGDEIEFEIIDINTEDRRVSLSLKKCIENPWEAFSAEHPINSVVEGTINNITEFGIFVKLNDDIDGLIHQSEISWEDNAPNMNSLFKPGDKVEAKVIDVNSTRKRVSLSIKQLMPNPVTTLFEKFKVGNVIQGKVVQWEDFGCFVNISNNVDGLLHISQIPNAKKDIKPKVGDIVEAEIIKLDKKNKKLSLSVWELFKKRYRENSIIEGKVVGLPEKGGVFIEVMPCVDLYIRQTELIGDNVQMNDVVRAVITKIDRENKMVFGSSKRIESKKEEEAYKDYIKKTQEEQKSFKNTVISQSLADILLKDSKKDT